ncbi:pyridoxamine 5'-phosphate oxidase family protein [Streptomyces sp. NPDC047315]|uniref:pyridoxamine 5'-phosphate oxidase family protein n=1 Tax=Streptomyces sp. NPDC047315 TaxID=3155142 RepID=UPI003407050C
MAHLAQVLTREERDEFLAQPHIGALSVDSGDDDRAPVTVPVWYRYEPGGDLWVMTAADSRKARLIAAAGRFSLMVDRVVPTVRYVSVEGPVVATSDATPEELEEITRHYLVDPVKVEEYLAFARREHGPQLVVRMRPQRWLSAELGEE